MDNKTIEEIRDKNVNVEDFVNRVIKDENLREEIIYQLVSNKDIMVYYHCYYIVSRASELKPELFYMYWDKFAALLNHKNSYHRDIGLTIIANLVGVDKNHYFDNILEGYLKHIDDEKFMTAQCLVRNLLKVVKNRKNLTTKIIETLLEVDKRSSYPEKQKELLKYDILQIFDMVYRESDFEKDITSFIKSASSSRSPKTKKKAKELIKKYFDVPK